MSLHAFFLCYNGHGSICRWMGRKTKMVHSAELAHGGECPRDMSTCSGHWVHENKLLLVLNLWDFGVVCYYSTTSTRPLWNFLQCWKCCISALTNMVSIDHMWLLSTWNVAKINEKLKFKFCSVVISLNLTGHADWNFKNVSLTAGKNLVKNL